MTSPTIDENPEPGESGYYSWHEAVAKHHNDKAGVGAHHAASRVSVSPSGLAVVSSTDVQGALSDLDVDVDSNSTHRQATGDAHALVDQTGIGVGDLVHVKSLDPLQLERLDSGTYEQVWGIQSAKYIWNPTHDTAAFAFSDGDARCTPLPIHAGTTFDRIACEVTTAGTTGAVVRLGVYANSGSDTPKGLLFDAGTVDGTTTGVKAITISETIGAGLVWLVAVNQGGASTPAELRYASSFIAPFFVGNSVLFTRSGQHSVSETGVTGSLPDPFGSTTRDQNPPLVALRAA